ncbi:MAG: 23S rRNA (pseudouridine(1915)-N(3))-methyltransferase RlmH [Gammaproteobacteria bacterium TMED78]|nr:MAG: 23S rRNA (pseudouridine(1915)-N(3))-methyltransferase RlmH [Gammaproteobacteria bacterium TMED78]
MSEIFIFSVSNRQPDWINDGFNNYVNRMKSSYLIKFLDIPMITRSKNMNPAVATKKEGELILKKIPISAFVVALDISGGAFSSELLAKKLISWSESRTICFLIGGPEGLSKACLSRANERWSLSSLTFPHGLVRILVIESLYRAHSINIGHPYHRT